MPKSTKAVKITDKNKAWNTATFILTCYSTTVDFNA